MKPPRQPAPFLWMGVALATMLVTILLFSDSASDLARLAIEYQRRVQFVVTKALRDVRNGTDSIAVWALATICFIYGAFHTLGPGHGKAVIVAYFLDTRRPRPWIEGVFAALWVAFVHVWMAVILATVLKTTAITGLLDALRQAHSVDIVSYGLVLAIALWRLWAGLAGRPHEHSRYRTPAGWLLLTAAGAAPCAGALIVVLVSATLGIVWAGVVGVMAIAAGMALTLALLGFASMVAQRLIVGDGFSREVGRGLTVAAAAIVIASTASLLMAALA